MRCLVAARATLTLAFRVQAGQHLQEFGVGMSDDVKQREIESSSGVENSSDVEMQSAFYYLCSDGDSGSNVESASFSFQMLDCYSACESESESVVGRGSCSVLVVSVLVGSMDETQVLESVL